MEQTINKNGLLNQFILQKKRLLYFIMFLLNFGSINAASIFNNTGFLEEEFRQNETNIDKKDVIVQINKDTLLIFTKDMVIVSQIDPEKSKLLQSDKHLNSQIKEFADSKHPKSGYKVVYADIKDNLNVINELGNNISIAEIIHDHQDHSAVYINKSILFIIILLPFLLLGYYYKKGKNTSEQNYEDIMENLKTSAPEISPDLETETLYTPECTEHKTKTMSINDDTVKHILARLAKFEKSQKYLRQDMSLSGLATYLDTNNKYLSEILKQYKGKKFSDYINGLRIVYITEVLYKNPIYREYKISYLAESCGFGSREVFAVVFKKETGISPSYFINNLKKDIREEQPPTNLIALNQL